MIEIILIAVYVMVGVGVAFGSHDSKNGFAVSLIGGIVIAAIWPFVVGALIGGMVIKHD